MIFTSPGNGIVEMPAIIVAVNRDGTCNLAVFMDADSIDKTSRTGDVPGPCPPVLSRGHVPEGAGPDTWHWPIRE